MGDRKQHGLEFVLSALVPPDLKGSGGTLYDKACSQIDEYLGNNPLIYSYLVSTQRLTGRNKGCLYSYKVRHNRAEANDFEVSRGFRDV